MTGILPIKKYNTQSALNNFLEYSMVEPRKMATFFGFTKDEVRMLAARHQMDFAELEAWYDGYRIGDEPSMFNPNSVIQAVDIGRCRSFWASTGAFNVVSDYISRNFKGLKDDVIYLLSGGRVKVNTTKFQNDLSSGKGFADLVLIPRKNVSKPALIIELKKDQASQTGIDQIKERNYPQKVAEHTGNILLVGINYDTQSKQHTCQIERWTKE